jgi:hypothetical protein
VQERRGEVGGRGDAEERERSGDGEEREAAHTVSVWRPFQHVEVERNVSLAYLRPSLSVESSAVGTGSTTE